MEWIIYGCKEHHSDESWQYFTSIDRFPGGSVVKNPPANAGDAGDVGSIPGSEKIAWRRAWQPHSSILAWVIPWREEPSRLQSMGVSRVRHD